jgi:hypothetical protein
MSKNRQPPERDDRGRVGGKKAAAPPPAAEAEETPLEAFDEEGAGIAAKE